MICKHCNAEVEENHVFCPFCGKDLNGQPAPKKVWPMVLGIVGAVVGMAVLGCLLLTAFGVNILPRANDIYKKDSYTVSAEKAVKNAGDVVATMGEKTLTNAELQCYYKYAIVYSQYNSAVDFSKPLDEQMCTVTGCEDQTWQQYFLTEAIDSWKNYQFAALLAEENGFTLDEEAETMIAEMEMEMKTAAEEGGYESVNAMVEETIGPGCTIDDFMRFMRASLVHAEYYNNVIVKDLEPTDEEVETFYTENVSLFEQSGVTKETGLYSSVRHILICPEGGTWDDATQQTVYSEDEWAAAKTKAEAVLEQWKNGDATEQSFGELAKTETADTYSAEAGGLYAGIYKGSGMVEEFQNWAIDPARVTGDTGIVKTSYGYHIMYFVQGEMNWLLLGRDRVFAEKVEALMDECEAKWDMKVKYGMIAIPELSLA